MKILFAIQKRLLHDEPTAVVLPKNLASGVIYSERAIFMFGYLDMTDKSMSRGTDVCCGPRLKSEKGRSLRCHISIYQMCR
jgi:hypothetical protein